MMAMKKKKHQPPIGKRSMTIFESGFGLRREPKVARGEGRGGVGRGEGGGRVPMASHKVGP